MPRDCRSALLFVNLGGGAGVTHSVTVGTATARAGQRVNGVISVPRGVDAATDVPVIVINGARPGATMALVAGAHGTEYASVLALQKLARAVDPASSLAEANETLRGMGVRTELDWETDAAREAS